MLASIRLFFIVLGALSPALAGRAAAWLFARPRRHRRPHRERALMARGTALSIPGGLRATAWGSGPVVLLVHGWEGRGAQLGAVVDPLVEAGYRVVALDGPAHGDSTGRTTTGPEFAAAMAAAREVLGPVTAIVAHSFGGFASLLAISRGFEVERLVTIAAPSSVPEVLAEFTRLVRLPSRALPAMVASLERRVNATMESFAIASFAATVSLPVLVIHDTEDKEVPYSNGIHMAEMLDARLMTTTGLGHRRVLFAPEVVRAIVEFIEAGKTAPAETSAAQDDR